MPRMVPSEHTILARVLSFARLGMGLVFMAVAVTMFAALVLLFLPSRSLRIRICNVFGHIAGRTCLWLSGATPPPGIAAQVRAVYPAIYVSNHTSMVDVFLGIWLAPMGTVGVAKKEIVYYPFFGQLYAISGHILLDRANHGSAVDALADTARIIQKYGIGVWMWPEGTRSRDGRLLPFKKGFAHLAIAPRSGLHQNAVFIAQVQRQSVDLGFRRVMNLTDTEKLFHPFVKIMHITVGKGILKAQHPHTVRHLAKARGHSPANLI